MSKPKKNTRTITDIYDVKIRRITVDGFTLVLSGHTPEGNDIKIHLVVPWGKRRTW